MSNFLQPLNGYNLGKVTIEIKGVDDPARKYAGLGGSNFDKETGNYVYQQLNFSTFPPTTIFGGLTINFNYDFITDF
ncbi:MAG: hypothetical protein IPF63_10285 [Bacteroidetes bacterium]|nr:hypothetical protein [Bacteroidota bacterium]